MGPNKTKALFGEEMLEKVLKGINTLYEATSMTLGPLSRAVGYDNNYEVKVNKDGISVAKAIKPEDPFEAFGVKVVREAAQKTVDEVGDGTTVTIILAHAFIHECLKAIKAGDKPMQLRKQVEEGISKLTTQLQELSIPVKTLLDTIKIATIAANGDTELGKLIAETLNKIGKDGVITVEESKNAETAVEIQEGMRLDQGWVHQDFVNNPERLSAIYEDVPVLVTDKPLTNMSELNVFFNNNIAPNTNKMILISPEIGGDVLPVLLTLKMLGKFTTLAIKAPGVGTNQRDGLHDICAITGAKFISKDAGTKFDDVMFEDLGKISRIEATKFATTITGGAGKKEDVKARLDMIKSQMKDSTLSDFEKEKLKERYGKLTNGIAVLKVGGATEVEMKERYERALDSVSATQAAIKDGVIPGGEVAYLNLTTLGLHPLFKRVLVSPFNKLVENADYDSGEMRLLQTQPPNFEEENNYGFNLETGKWGDMVRGGVIDPVNVAISALKNSSSVAIQIFTLGAVVVGVPETKP